MSSYMYEGAKYMINEAWQLGADATSEAGNIASEFYSNIKNILLQVN
jgi:hypothetical protein